MDIHLYIYIYIYIYRTGIFDLAVFKAFAGTVSGRNSKGIFLIVADV